ncbi:MAG: tetratricopeptide repeat protein [Ketobacteraceae bacterium]|nr:tetratricopeptide repeat protein [Ketobacteraceae bacterium]
MTLNQQIEHNPDDAYLLIKRAQELIQEDKAYQKAKADLEKARKLGANESSSHEFNFVTGLWHQYQDQWAEAADAFSRCIEMDTNHLQCHRGLAEIRLAQKDPHGAIEVLTRLIKSSEAAQTDDYFHLAQLLEQQGKPAEALKYLDQAQARFGALPHFEKYAIKIELSQNHLDKALRRHQSLEPYFGKTPQWQYDLGVLFQKAGKPAEARSAFEKALALLEKLKSKTSDASAKLQQEIRDRLAALD